MTRRVKMLIDVTLSEHDKRTDTQIIASTHRRLATLGTDVTVTIDETVQYPTK